MLPDAKAHDAQFAAPRIVDTSRAAGLAERLHHIRVASSHCGYLCIALCLLHTIEGLCRGHGHRERRVAVGIGSWNGGAGR